MIRKNIYKWHRWCSAVIAIPVIMWTISGIMHPIMTSFKPQVKKQFLKPEAIDVSAIRISLKQALEKNHIFSINNFRIIVLKDEQYYQVKRKDENILVYFSTTNGKILPNGDEKYAQQLACRFLADSSKISHTELIEQFNKEYVYVNRLLPVYKISFDRPDRIRIYVDTFADRMALSMNDSRSTFNRFFVNFHSWGFIDGFDDARLLVIVLLSSLAFFTSIMGIYIWLMIRRKNKVNRSTYRRWHSRIAILASLTTLMFTFSGAFHAFKKLRPDNLVHYFYAPDIASTVFEPDFDKILSALSKDTIVNFSIVKMNDKNYWQVTQKNQKGITDKCYLDVKSYILFPEGEKKYASFLSNNFSGNSDSEIAKTEVITKFTDEYGFINKRLPVIKVQYSKNDNERYYVETSTGKLAARLHDKDLVEGYSFALFHKYHFMEFAGKTGRDVTTVVTATATLVVTILGMILFVTFLIKRRKNT